jgi:hypothetical protein
MCGILGLGIMRYMIFEAQYHRNEKIDTMTSRYPIEIFFTATGPIFMFTATIVSAIGCKERHSHCFGFYATSNLIFPDNHPNAKNMNPKLISATE